MEKVVFTSIPKTGTHLLLRYFYFINFKQAGPYAVPFFDKKFYDFIRNLKSGEYSVWHYHWSEELAAITRDVGAKVVFLYRDPRAWVSSTLHWIMRSPTNPLHELFANHFKTDQERIEVLIKGSNSDAISPPIQSMNNFWHTYEGWLYEPNVYKVRFEDIIGPRGGGDKETQLRVLGELMQFTGVRNESVTKEEIIDQLFSSEVETFRKGTIDSWREDFTPELHDLFLKEAGELLKVWGYAP
ncbi:MAG TPA: sulfotransferase domain-containing protein [Candidatus Omnitrophota bacterium]|nr:sulfotransferase domain-containing protein [Candidatus Omnitrophota bacterium]